MRVWGEDPLLCPKCKTTMKVVDKILRPEEIEFFLKLYNLWEGILAIPPPPNPPFDVETMEPIRTPPVYTWWKPEASDPAQFELTTPHWSPDFESQDWQKPHEITLDTLTFIKLKAASMDISLSP